jgi:hypothetical protein
MSDERATMIERPERTATTAERPLPALGATPERSTGIARRRAGHSTQYSCDSIGRSKATWPMWVTQASAPP